jgi:hypothetical protein
LVLKIGFAGMPPVLAAPFAKTRPGLMSVADIPTYGPQQVAHLGEGWPSGLGLWTKPAPDGLSPDIATEVLRRIARVADPMGNVLHSAVTTDSGLWLSITHNGRLFAVGGILATEAQLMADLRRAAADIAALVAATGAGLALAVWLADQVTPAAPETALDVRTSALPKPGPAR